MNLRWPEGIRNKLGTPGMFVLLAILLLFLWLEVLPVPLFLLAAAAWMYGMDRFTPSNGEPSKMVLAADRFVSAVNRWVLEPLGTALKVIATVLIVLFGVFMCTNDDLECWLNGREYMSARGAVCPAVYWWQRFSPQP